MLTQKKKLLARLCVALPLSFFLLCAVYGITFAQDSAPKPSSRNKTVVFSIHGRLFSIDSDIPGALVLATAEGVYYKLEGPALNEVKKAFKQAREKEIWLRGRKSGQRAVTTRIRRDDKSDPKQQAYKEITEYVFFSAEAIEKIGQEVAIAPPAPRRKPLTDEDRRQVAAAIPKLPETVLQIEGTIAVPSRKTSSPFKVISVIADADPKKRHQVFITSDTKIYAIIADSRNKLQTLPTDSDSLKDGDRVQAWIKEKNGRFEAQTVSILK